MLVRNGRQPSFFGYIAAFGRLIWQVRWPLSVKLLASVAVLFALQAFPLTGVALMIVAAPFWSVPMVNAATIVAGIEGLVGRAPRWFMLVPVCWFGGYGYWVEQERAAFAHLEAEVAQASAGLVPVTYDPARDNLVAKGLGNDLINELLIRHRLPVIYSEQASRQGRTMTAQRLASGAICDRIAKGEAGTEVQVRKIHHLLARRYCLHVQDEICVVTVQEAPERAPVSLAMEKKSQSFSLIKARVHVFRADAGGRTVESRRIGASLLQALPMPVIGCALNSAAPAWVCDAGFWRERKRWVGAATDEEALLSLIDLSGVVGELPGEAGNQVVRERIAAAERRLDAMRAAELEAFLAAPRTISHGDGLFQGFENRPEKLAPFADRLMSALEVADREADPKGRDHASTVAGSIARLVAQLPDADIERLAPRILALLDRDMRGRGWWRYANELMARTAVLGETALPMLVRRLDASVRNGRVARPVRSVIVALCRMGPAAAAAAGPKLLEIWRERSRQRLRVYSKGPGERREVLEAPSLGREDMALYVALLRLGLGDEAGAASAKNGQRWWDRARATISPRSPANVCERHRRL